MNHLSQGLPRKPTAPRWVVAVLTQEILNNPEPIDFVIASEHQLRRRFSVSRVTVRLALSHLEHGVLVGPAARVCAHLLVFRPAGDNGPGGYQITASNNPTTFATTPLPAGLTVNSSGLISGTPTAAGTSAIVTSATGASGTITAKLGIVVYATAQTTNTGALYSTHLITQEAKPEGRFITNAYDGLGRVTQQQATVGAA